MIDWDKFFLDDPAEAAERAAQIDGLRRALAALPDLERQVIELRFGIDRRYWADPRSHQEVAELLDITIEESRRYEGHALTRLQALVLLAQLPATGTDDDLPL